jgi:histidine triad (HIT) family protein
VADLCPFCRAASGDVDTRLVAEWPDTIAIEPLDPVTAGHLLVIPRVHVEDALSDPVVTGYVYQRAAELAARLRADNVLDPTGAWFAAEGVNLITSAGPAATATIKHLHAHLVPRRFGDGLTLPWTGQVIR